MCADRTSELSSLGELADPRKFNAPISVGGWPAEELKAMLRTMKLIRAAEEEIADLVTAGEVRCPCHLAIGQEACAVGIACALDVNIDRVFGAHRSHGHYLALGGELDGLLAEVLGRETGCSRGMGGSMHLVAPERGLLGTVPIVGATVPMAVGAALAARMDGNGGVGVAFFGDGTAEEGVFHESLNLAAVMQLPVIFACENNFFSSHLHISLRQPTDCVARFAEAQGVACETIDGNDVTAVAASARRAVERARGGEGPTFIEMVTYRWRGHVGPREDFDVGVKRSADLPLWKGRDPIRRLTDALLGAHLLTDDEIRASEREIAKSVTLAVARARAAPFPAPDATTRYMYTETAL